MDYRVGNRRVVEFLLPVDENKFVTEKVKALFGEATDYIFENIRNVRVC